MFGRMRPIGLYIHVPFCVSKCPYCDFYSLAQPTGEQLDAYTARLCAVMEEWAERLPATTADTLYFGGGTPALLGGERLAAVIACARARFGLDAAEITLEANPADDLRETFAVFAAAGGNRLSLGMQSAFETELNILGRRHTPADVERTVSHARAAGIDNISLDVMLGISGQTEQTARASARVAAQLGASHVSAYLLKIEPNTPYGRCAPPLPDEDATADLYLAAMEELDRLGYRQYEISNTALAGKESRHNLKYWQSEPYLGIGPAASSCVDGRRFAYPRDLAGFMCGNEPIDEPTGGITVGSPTEYALLRMRLADGIDAADFSARFGLPLPTAWHDRAVALPPSLVQSDGAGIRLTREGFLLSNTLINRILTE